MSGVVILGKDSSNNALKPVELTALGLVKCDVSGVSTAGNQSTANSSLASIDGKILLPSALSASSNLKVSIEEGQIVGYATSTNQSTAIASLSSIDGKLTEGQQNKANSLSVTIASDQGSLSVSAPALSVSSTTIFSAVAVANSATGNSSVIDMRTAKCVSIYGTTNDTDAEFKLMASNSSAGTYYELNSVYIQGDYTTGDFGIMLDNVGASYLRLDYVNTSGGSKTITAISEIKS